MRFRLLPLLSLAAALAPAVPAVATAATPKATGAYVYFKRTEGRLAKYEKGNAWVVFRTDAALPEQQRNVDLLAEVGSRSGSSFVLSHTLHCYGVRVTVQRGDRLTVGSRVRVRIGKGGSILDRRMTVGARRSGSSIGRPLGCDADPRTRVAYSGLTQQPEFEPFRVFYSADAGPYVDELQWTGWGTSEATGSGTYISDCASCGPPERYPAQIVLGHPRYEAADGFTFYTSECLRKLIDGVWTGRDVRTGKAC